MTPTTHRPHPRAATRGELKAHIASFPKKLDAIQPSNIAKAPRHLKPILWAANRAARANHGKPWPIVTGAATTAALDVMYRMQLEPYACPMCKKEPKAECKICLGKGMVRWDGDVNGGPR